MSKQKNPPQKMSEILKTMASMLLKDPEAIPSAEAAHAALLIAHVAWNRSVGEDFTDRECQSILRKFEKSRPSFWVEMVTKDWRIMIERLVEYKKARYPDDKRVVVVCGMRVPGVVHVEWEYAPGAELAQ